MPYSGVDDASLPSDVKKMDAPARKKWVSTWNSVYADCTDGGGATADCEGKAFKVANGNARTVGELPAAVRGVFEGVFTKVNRAEDGKIYFRTTCSDDGVDKYATRMTTDLHEDFIRNAEGMIGMPYLTIAHYNELARVGRATKLYRDGRRLKAEGVFWTDHEDAFIRGLAQKAADAALQENDLMPRLRRIRTSIGFQPQAAESEDLGVMAYTRGILPEIAMTTYPGNSRMEFDAGRSDQMETRALKPEFMREDALNIVGEEMADELDKRLKAIIGEQRSDADALELLYRAADERTRIAVPRSEGKGQETTSWDGAAALARARIFAGPADKTDWKKYERFFAVMDSEKRDSFAAYGSIHHDIDEKGEFVSLAGVVAAGAAASGPTPNLEAQKHLESHYAEFNRTAPWKRDRSNMAHRIEDIDDLRMLQRSGLVEEQAVKRAIEEFGKDAFYAQLSRTDKEIVTPIEGGFEYRTGTLEPVVVKVAPLPARVGRRLQGKKLSEMETAIKALTDIMEWAKVEESANEAPTLEPRAVAPALPFREALKERQGYDTPPDQSLIDSMNMQAIRETIFDATFTLADIVCANFEADDPEDTALTLEQRMANIQSAGGEYLQVINSLLMSAYGGGRSLRDDNKGDMKPQETDVKPEGGATGSVNAPGESTKPDLQRFEQTVEQMRQHILLGDPEKVQEGLNELVPAIEAAMGPAPENSEALDGVLARVAGLEIGQSTMIEQLAQIADRLESRPEAEPTSAYRPPVPRRRGFAPGPSPTPPKDERRDPRRPLTISEVARRSVEGSRYP